jgi:casein kinase II subunit alpha
VVLKGTTSQKPPFVDNSTLKFHNIGVAIEGQMSEDNLPLAAAPRDSAFPEKTITDNEFNPNHPLISSVYANVNLQCGSSHWDFRRWNPAFGQLTRYSIVKWIGGGRYSDVFAGLVDSSELCAIKVLKPINQDKIRREVKIMQILSGHPNILRLQDVLLHPDTSIISLVTEFVDNRSWREFISRVKLSGIRLYIYKLLSALEFAHSHGIMHRDVKFGNVLCLDPTTTVKLADWGLAEFYHPMRKYSSRVGTLPFKSPELLFNLGFYNYAVDIWALGCIFLGMLTGVKRVFDGQFERDVTNRIVLRLGGQKLARWLVKYKLEISEMAVRSYEAVTGTGFDDLFGPNRRKFKDEAALDLVKKMLTIDHKKRISAHNALNHAFFAELRDS